MSHAMQTPPLYSPEPNSPPARVLDLFCRMPDEEYKSSDLALKFQIRAAAFEVELAEPLRHGLLSFDKGTGGSRYWRAGPNLKPWAAARAELALAAVSVRGMAAVSRQQRKRAPLVPPASMVDLLAMPIRKNVPIPEPVRGGRHSSRYHALWLRLEPGDCVELPARQAAGFSAYTKKNKLSAVVRATGPGLKTVWRTA